MPCAEPFGSVHRFRRPSESQRRVIVLERLAGGPHVAVQTSGVEPSARGSGKVDGESTGGTATSGPARIGSPVPRRGVAGRQVRRDRAGSLRLYRSSVVRASSRCSNLGQALRRLSRCEDSSVNNWTSIFVATARASSAIVRPMAKKEYPRPGDQPEDQSSTREQDHSLSTNRRIELGDKRGAVRDRRSNANRPCC